MPNFNIALKNEIARVARKELRDELATLRKSSATLRADVSNLRKQVKALDVTLRTLGRSIAKPPKPAQPDAAPAREDRKVAGVFNPESLLAKRHELGLTQVQMAKLLGVSSLTQYKWESGQAVPRASKLPGILTVLALGKRAALAKLGG